MDHRNFFSRQAAVLGATIPNRAGWCNVPSVAHLGSDCKLAPGAFKAARRWGALEANDLGRILASAVEGSGDTDTHGCSLGAHLGRTGLTSGPQILHCPARSPHAAGPHTTSS